MYEKRKLKITENEEGKRLDIAIAEHFNDDWTRSYIKRVIESNNVKVNGELEFKANRKMRLNDEIVITPIREEVNEDILPEDLDLDIVYEDEDLIVINKPAGMVVHPSVGNWTGTVMNGLVHQFRDLKNVGERVRSGLIHRLDKDTSGLLLIGKTNKGLWHYSKQFAERHVQKTYLVAVSGTLPDSYKLHGKWEVRNYMGRNTLNRKKMRVVSELDVAKKQVDPDKFVKLRTSQARTAFNTSSMQNLPSDARIAHTFFELIESKGNRHLCFAMPRTGRTHQIRVHSAYSGIPVIGDGMYGGEKFQRMMLHAYKIQIMNTEGKQLNFVAHLDDQFKGGLNELGFKLTYDSEIISNIHKK